jgi:hypothetical protein
MTLLAAAACPVFAVIVSDRLIILQKPRGVDAGAQDPIANKTVVVLSLDAVSSSAMPGLAPGSLAMAAPLGFFGRADFSAQIFAVRAPDFAN